MARRGASRAMPTCPWATRQVTGVIEVVERVASMAPLPTSLRSRAPPAKTSPIMSATALMDAKGTSISVAAQRVATSMSSHAWALADSAGVIGSKFCSRSPEKTEVEEDQRGDSCRDPRSA